MMNNKVDEPRNLNDYEKGVLGRLLSSKIPGGKELLEQLTIAKVKSQYSNEDPSIVLQVDERKAKPANIKQRIPVEGEAIDADKIKIHFLVHVVNGYLDELEIFREDSGQILKLPSIREIEIVEY